MVLGRVALASRPRGSSGSIQAGNSHGFGHRSAEHRLQHTLARLNQCAPGQGDEVWHRVFCRDRTSTRRSSCVCGLHDERRDSSQGWLARCPSYGCTRCEAWWVRCCGAAFLIACIVFWSCQGCHHCESHAVHILLWHVGSQRFRSASLLGRSISELVAAAAEDDR